MIYATRLGPFEPSATARDNQELAAAAPVLTRAVRRQELRTPSGGALFGTDTSGLAQSYILYSGRDVLPIGSFLGNVPAPALATLQADISRGYVRVFVLPVSPPGPDSRVRWIESHCTRQPPQPQPDRSPPCRGKPQGAGPDIPDASRTPPPPGCRCEQSPPRDRPCTSTAAGHGNRDHHVRARARSGQHHGASRRAAAPRSVGRSSERGVAGRREGRRPGGRAACPAGNRMGPGEVCRVGGGRSEAADLGHQRPRRVQSAPTWRGGLNGNSPRRAPAPRYAAD